MQCHPNNNGYAHLPVGFLAWFKLPPAPPPPGPGPAGKDGAFVYEFEGDGKLFVPLKNFTKKAGSTNTACVLSCCTCRC